MNAETIFSQTLRALAPELFQENMDPSLAIKVESLAYSISQGLEELGDVSHSEPASLFRVSPRFPTAQCRTSL